MPVFLAIFKNVLKKPLAVKPTAAKTSLAIYQKRAETSAFTFLYLASIIFLRKSQFKQKRVFKGQAIDA